MIENRSELSSNCHDNFSSVQVENRYKTVMKRKKAAVTENRQSGASRTTVPYEDELNKIAAVDDNIEPDVMRSVDDVTGKAVPSTSGTKTPQRKRKREDIGDKISAALLKINEERG